YKYHMFDLIAAIGVAQFPKLERWYPIREKLWKRYDAAIGQMPGVRAVPMVMPGRHALHLYVIEIDPAVVSRTRDQLMDYLQANNVGVGIHYYGMHLQPYYAQKYGLTPEQFPNATRASERMLSLPLYPKMTLDDVDDVVAVLRAGIGA
ncbi:MAG: DegT/DnrJ/EryC1/StrS aminotransferase family protein, partial [Candidatus Eremiobacteraeota bacterium]|nr:DegT/DnrJ/EryC1/StrS aminotransferase family protein [Candidatus Eremiobacteraeota bacterium]